MIVVTGANGFVGRSVARALERRGLEVIGIVRRPQAEPVGWECVFDRPDFEGIGEHLPNWGKCDAVIHLAARVHVMTDRSIDPLDAYRQTNVRGTLRIAEAAARAGARRFVYVSSIKAVGESSSGRAPLSERDKPMPSDPYGLSKLEAEIALREFGRRSGLEIVVVRPPLVYGPGVRANFLSLMDAVAKRVPLPLGAISARRSLIFVENLADVVTHCALEASAVNETFHVADSHDPGVAELVQLIGQALDVRPRLIPVPVSWLMTAGRLTGRMSQVERLAGELRVDTEYVRTILGWKPPFDLEAGLLQTAAWYRADR
ncbi:NAD-dependent epimerase/dehydratase family protein [Burkholderia ubonensis]|uniref:NAD-dependent epimerase/dehydratase family protein n=1 Tax=Burkholderia ubonensis TaxID=101571 RepID=UPI0008FDC502|nr:NAD-dependent epimerase/dehydratase family protein [Burkholderia ubonensis]OJA26977.1 NAD-dependent dehydratase [Burkholderia ubonensis]